MGKRIKKIFSVMLIVFVFATPIFAEWYSVSITLPRNGAWTSTRTRPASEGTQKLKVQNNKYEVKGRIVSKNYKKLSEYKTHAAKGKSGYGHIKYHTTDVGKGTQIRCQFTTNPWNQKTTTAKLSWEP